MPFEFGTDGWVNSLRDELNASKGYREAAKSWEGDFNFVVRAGDGISENTCLYMDLWHGECREAYRVAGAQTKAPEFTIEAPLSIWRQVIEKKLDPIQAIVMRRLKLKGNLLKIMAAPRAALELVQCCTRIPTEWPKP